MADDGNSNTPGGPSLNNDIDGSSDVRGGTPFDFDGRRLSNSADVSLVESFGDGEATAAKGGMVDDFLSPFIRPLFLCFVDDDAAVLLSTLEGVSNFICEEGLLLCLTAPVLLLV